MDTKKLRQKILDLAIRGKLVPQDPNDEPASVLLERIRAEKEQLIKEGKIKRSKKSTATDKSHYENVPFEIPESWVWTTLGEISNYGQCENVNIDDIAEGEWILELEDIEKDTGRILQKLSKTDRKVCGTRHKFRTDEVLYSKLRTYLNKVLVAPSPGFCTSEIIPINCLCSNSQYLCMVLRSNYYLDYTASLGYGVKMPRLGTNDALISCIPLPPLNEQNRIVNEVKKWEKVIDIIESGSNDLLASVAHIKSKILDFAISGKLVPQDPNDEPTIELLRRINPDFKPCDNSHYGNLPQGWAIVGLHSVAEIITGSTPSKLNAEYYNGDVPFYKPNDLDQGRHVRCASEYLSQQGKSISRSIPCNSIAVCCIGSIGKCGFIEKEGVTNQQINTIVPNDAIFPLYMYYFCNSSTFIDELKSLSSAVTISIVNKSKLSTIQIPLPPIAEQKRIISVIEKLYSHLDMITAEL